MMIRAIAAIDRELGIAKDGLIPWKLPTDEQYFTDMTKRYGGVTLTGWRTFQTFHGPLKDRVNYIVTEDPTPIPGAFVVNDLDRFLEELKTDLWIVGGGMIFKETIGRTDELYITHVDGMFDCDTFFPPFEDNFELVSKQAPMTDNGLTFYYAIYHRKQN